MTQSTQIARRGLFEGDALSQAKAALQDALQAGKSVRAPRDASGVNQYEYQPDYPTRVKAAVAILELETGKATAKQDVTHRAGGAADGPGELTQEQIQDMAKKNPDMLARIASDWVQALPEAEAVEPDKTEPDKTS